jgi:transposase
MDIPLATRNLIISHSQDGYSCREISTMVNVGKSAINNIIRRHSSTGSCLVNRVGRCGRSRSLSVRDERALGRESLREPAATSRQIRAKVGSAGHVSLRTIQRALLRQGHNAIRPKKSPSLTKAKRLARLRWCRAHSEWGVEKWEKVRWCRCINKSVFM